jgi:hypothetical protein
VSPGGTDRDPPTSALGVPPPGLTGLSERANGDAGLLAVDGGLLAVDEPPGTAGLAEVERAEPGAPALLPLRSEAQRDTNS